MSSTTLSRRRPPSLAFAHLNLLRNPFGEVPFSERGALAIAEVEQYLPGLQGGGLALQFLGDKGNGKTTHLLALREHFPAAPYLHVGEGQVGGDFPEGELFFLDELQRVPRAARRSLYARSKSLVLGTHRDYRAELERAGFRVETIRPGCLLDESRLAHILGRRLESARRGPGAIPSVQESTLKRLLARFGSDVRAMESELYTQICDLKEVRDV